MIKQISLGRTQPLCLHPIRKSDMQRRRPLDISNANSSPKEQVFPFRFHLISHYFSKATLLVTIFHHLSTSAAAAAEAEAILSTPPPTHNNKNPPSPLMQSTCNPWAKSCLISLNSALAERDGSSPKAPSSSSSFSRPRAFKTSPPRAVASSSSSASPSCQSQDSI